MEVIKQENIDPLDLHIDGNTEERILLMKANSLNVDMKQIKVEPCEEIHDFLSDIKEEESYVSVTFPVLKFEVKEEICQLDMMQEELVSDVMGDEAEFSDRLMQRHCYENFGGQEINMCKNPVQNCKVTNLTHSQAISKDQNSGLDNCSADKNLRCGSCSKVFNTTQLLERHDCIDLCQRLFKCNICKESFTKLLLLKQHSQIHTHNVPLKCDICNICSDDSSSLERHRELHIEEVPLKCEICAKSFYYSFDLKEHIRVHAQENQFKCNFCSKVFEESSTLEKHIRIHTEEKPYNCDVCGKVFNQSISLKAHSRIHTGPFHCNFCSKVFNRASVMKDHLRLHTGEKPFKCKFCPKDFAHSSNLKNHIRIHMGKALQLQLL